MSLDSPEETRPFEAGTGQLQLVNMKEGAVGRATFLPGWRWSLHVKPIAKTESCQAAHMGYFISGRMSRASAGLQRIRLRVSDRESLRFAVRSGTESACGLRRSATSLS